MSLRPCPACDRKVSTGAKSCPQCGHEFKRDGQASFGDPVQAVGLVIGLGFLLMIVIWTISKFQ